MQRHGRGPAGPDVFAFALYDGTNGTGNVLSSGSVTQTIVANAVNAVNATLNGTVASVSLTVPSLTVKAGVATALPVIVNAKDADGNTIVGPGGYSVPVVLADSDTSGVTAISPATVTGPGAAATFSYNGGPLPGQVAIVSSAKGVSNAGYLVFTAAPVGTPYQHIVVLIQENRSFDNIFGDPWNASMIPGMNVPTSPPMCQPVPAGGATCGPSGATTVCSPPPGPGATCPPLQLTSDALLDPESPNHTYAALVDECNPATPPPGFASPSAPCRMDGFAATAGDGPGVYSYVTHLDVYPYLLLAQTYGLADAIFSDGLSPSLPGHQALVAGLGPADSGGQPWSCAGDTTAPLYPTADLWTFPTPGPQAPICYDYPTLATRIDAIPGATWKYFNGEVPENSFDTLIDAFQAVRAVYDSTPLPVPVPSSTPTMLTEYQRNVVPRDQFFSSIVATPVPGTTAPPVCALPTVAWLTADGTATDHPGLGTGGLGPSWVSYVYQQIAQSPCYGSTAVLVVWDDSGGFYDHAPPPWAPNAPPPGFTGYRGQSLGFRVPLIFMAYNGVPHKLSHTMRDFGSILRFIENDIGAPPLGSADLDFGGDALSDFYTLGPAVTITPIPVSVLAAHSRAPMSRKFWRDQPPEAGDDY